MGEITEGQMYPSEIHGPHSQPHHAVGMQNRIGRRHLGYKVRKEYKAKDKRGSPGNPRGGKERECSYHQTLKKLLKDRFNFYACSGTFCLSKLLGGRVWRL